MIWLERKNSVLLSNKRVVSENEKLIREVGDSLTKKLAELSQILHATRNRLQDEASQFDSSQKNDIADQVEKINIHFGRAQDLFQEIETQEALEDQALDNLKRNTEKARQSFNVEIVTWANGFTSSSSQLCESSAKAVAGHIKALDHSNTVLNTLIETISGETCTYVNEQHAFLDELQLLAKAVADKEITHLQRQNKILTEMLEEQRKDAKKAQSDFLQSVSCLLGDFMRQRDETLKRSVDSLQSSNKEVEDLLTSTCERQTTLHDSMLTKNDELAQRMETAHEQAIGETGRATEVIAHSLRFYLSLIICRMPLKRVTLLKVG